MSEEQLNNVGEAEFILNHPLFKNAFEAVRNDLFAAIETVSITDRDTANQLILSTQVLARIKTQIEYHVETGKLINFTRVQEDLNYG